MSKAKAGRPIALTTAQIATALKTLKGWSLNDGKLYKKFEFADFSQAMSFMVRAISQIEKANHHPEWLNAYNRVEVFAITHDVDKSKTPAITVLDVDLAKHLNSIS